MQTAVMGGFFNDKPSCPLAFPFGFPYLQSSFNMYDRTNSFL
jgi:hypothetical protein